MRIKKRHYKMALCAGRCRETSLKGLSGEQIDSVVRAVDAVWKWNFYAAKLKGYK